MKFWSLLFVVILMVASTTLYQVDVTPEGSDAKVVRMGWPFPVLETTTTVDANQTSQTSYDILFVGLVVNIAVYTAIVLFLTWIFG